MIIDDTPQDNSQNNPETEETTSTQPGISDSTSALLQEIDTLKQQVAHLEETLLRSHADHENYRKRLEREKMEAEKYAVYNFARDMLEGLDNLDRTLNSQQNTEAEPASLLQALREGLTLTRQEWIRIFEKYKVKLIPSLHQPLNPHLHQAVGTRPSNEHAPNTILDVLQEGYMHHDRVLRPALVIVAQSES